MWTLREFRRLGEGRSWLSAVGSGLRWPPPRALALGFLLAGVLLLRPMACGLSLGASASFWLFVLANVVPGVLVCRAAGLYGGDPLLLWGQGCALGLSLQGLTFVASRALGAPWLEVAAPLLISVLALGLARGGGEPPGGSARVPSAPTLLLAVALLACLLQPLFSVRLLGDPIPADLLFHAGNAAELRHRWPLHDPRVAGLPLNYPILAYALPCAASRFIGLPVADALLTLAPLFWILLLVLQLQNAGRVLFGDGAAGVLGAAVVVLHTDPGRVLGLGPGAFNSFLPTGLYGSPTTVCGLILLASLAVALAQALEESPLRLASQLILVPYGLAAAATKASVVPPVVAGLGLVTLLSLRRGRGGPARAALAAALVLGLCASPFLVSFSSGDSSYRSIFRWGPGAVAWSSPFAVKAGQALARLGLSGGAAPGDLPLVFLLLVFSTWVVGYLALGGAGAAVFLRLRREPLSPPMVWALGVAASGAAVGLLLQGQGLSQLFFFYDGQALLGLFAGAGLASVGRSWPRHRGLALGLAGFAIPSLFMLAGGLPSSVSHDAQVWDRPYSGLAGAYAGGLAWLRANATEKAVVFADNPSFLLSALGECSTFYESGLFTPEGWRKRWSGPGEPYPERVLLQEQLLRHPSLESAAAAARLFPPGTVLRVVADNVQSRISSGTVDVALGPVPGRLLLPPDLFRLEFANAAMHVYRLQTAP